MINQYSDCLPMAMITGGIMTGALAGIIVGGGSQFANELLAVGIITGGTFGTIAALTQVTIEFDENVHNILKN